MKLFFAPPFCPLRVYCCGLHRVCYLSVKISRVCTGVILISDKCWLLPAAIPRMGRRVREISRTCRLQSPVWDRSYRRFSGAWHRPSPGNRVGDSGHGRAQTPVAELLERCTSEVLRGTTRGPRRECFCYQPCLFSEIVRR